MNEHGSITQGLSPRRKAYDITMRTLLYVSAAIICALLVFLIGYILYRGIPSLSWQFLTSEESVIKDIEGILPAILNTVYVIIATLIFILPLGVGSAIYLTEYATNKRLVAVIEFATETLSGMPSIIFALVGVIVFCELFGLGISPFLPGWLGADPSLQANATAYFAIWSTALPFTMAMGMYASILRAAGYALTASLISVLVCVLDAIFNFFLINPTRTLWGITVWGAGLGVPGAALGTALATVVGGLLALAILLLREGPLCIRKPAPWKITRSCLRNLLWVGGPLAGERAAISLAQVVVVRIVAGLGTVAIAANSLAVNAEGLCYMAGYGIQSAAVTLIGQAVGANRKDMAKRFAWLCTGLGMGVMALSGVGLWIFAPTLMSLFTTDAAVITLGAQVLRIEAWAEPMFGASIVASGAMQGAGDSTSCFVLNIFSMWCIRLTLAFLLAPRLGLMGVWGAMCCELSIRGLLFLIRLARGKWLEKGALS